MAQLTEELELSPSQVAQVEALLSEEDLAIQDLVDGARRELTQPISERHEQTEERLLALLEPEQRRLYDDLSQR